MGRDSRIQVYVSEDRKKWLKEQADAADQSCSEYCRQVITEHIDQGQDEQQYRRYGVDQQIELALTELRDETKTLLSNFQSGTGTRLEYIQRVRTVYTIALWRLLEQDYPESQRNAAMKYGVKHAGRNLTDDPEIHPLLSSQEGQFPTSEAGHTEPTPVDTNREDSE